MHHSLADRLFKVFLLLFANKAPATVKQAPELSPTGVPPVSLNQTIPAVFAFGDSILDTGNNNNINTLTKCNFPPYGRDFLEGKPTGRFCNGKIPSDLIADELGIKPTLPAYQDPNLRNEDLPTGVSFASGGSGNDDLTALIQGVWKLSDQLRMFKEYIEKLKGVVGEDRANNILSNSLYLFSAGNNDIAIGYALTTRARQYDFPSYASQLVQWNSDFVKELYGLGARKIGVLSTLPLGCLPGERTTGLTTECVERVNEQAKLFNSNLSSMVESMKMSLPKSQLFFIDFYNALFNIIQNSQNLGFTDTSSGCCGTGTAEMGLLCNVYNTFTCSDTSEYVFWDSGHPSEKTYNIMVSNVLQNLNITSD